MNELDPANDRRAAGDDVRAMPRWQVVARARAPLQRPALRRSAWVVVDQGISSFSNFAAAVLVARAVSERMFGAFSVAFLVYSFAISVGRGLVSQPLAIRASVKTEQHDDVAAAAGAALVCGTVAGLIVLPAGVVIGDQAGQALIVTGVLLPALVLQDTWRYALFTLGHPARAAGNDLVWLVVQTALILLVLALSDDSVPLLTAAWAGGAVVAAALGLRQAAAVPAVGRARTYLRRHLALGWRFAGEVVLGNGIFQLTMLVIGATLGIAGIGALRGGAVLFGPLNVALFAISTGGIAEGSRLLARAPDRVLPVLSVVSGVLVVVSLMWGALLFAVPDSVGRDVLGETWPGARELVVAYAVTNAGLAVAGGAGLVLRVVAAASASLRLAMIMACVTFASGAAGALWWGAAGAVWGFAISAWIQGVGAWWLVGRFRRNHPLVFARAADVTMDVESVDSVAPGSDARGREIAGDSS